jgi:hypothetical protein
MKQMFESMLGIKAQVDEINNSKIWKLQVLAFACLSVYYMVLDFLCVVYMYVEKRGGSILTVHIDEIVQPAV